MAQGDLKKGYDAGGRAYQEKSSHWSYGASLFITIMVVGALSAHYGLSWIYKTALAAVIFLVVMGLFTFGRRILSDPGSDEE